MPDVYKVRSMLRSIDLFSGIGGIAHALRGISEPQLYCEIDPICHRILKRNMKKGRLRPARLCTDIRQLDAAMLKEVGPIDLVTAGFPCIGFSNLGHQKGFENGQSSLYHQVIRITRFSHPPFVFLENVPPILSLGMNTIVRDFSALGYRLRWCIVGGLDVGARHVRRRWFCLATRADVHSFDLSIGSAYRRYDWTREGAPRMKLERDNTDLRRNRTLGNAVVPDAVRYAFLYLFAGGVVPPANLHPTSLALAPISTMLQDRIDPSKTKTLSFDVEASGPKYPMDGCTDLLDDPRAVSMHTFSTNPREHPTHLNPPMPALRFSPDLFKPMEGAIVSPKRGSALVTQQMERRLWSTPRYSSVTCSSILTDRCLRDLPTQVRFELDTPDHLRPGRLHPEFSEWLMGYPIGWTAFRLPRGRGSSALSDHEEDHGEDHGEDREDQHSQEDRED